MIIDVKSTNPDLSWCLNKNPETVAKDPFTRDLRKGRVFGWFLSVNHFRLWFKDAAVESSFAKGNRSEFEYLDRTRYSSPQVALAAISEAFSNTVKAPEKKDTPFESEVSAMIWASSSTLTWLSQSLTGEGCSLTITPKLSEDLAKRLSPVGLFSVAAKAPTVHQAMNIFAAVMIFQCLNDSTSDLIWKEENLIRYAGILRRADLPAGARAKFLARTINNRNSFDKISPLLAMGNATFRFGNTQIQRGDFVSSVLQGGKLLVDIGCGEGYHLGRLCEKYDGSMGIDKESYLKASVKAKMDSTNSSFIEQEVTARYVEETCSMFEGADVLLSEVLEHMPLDTAKALLKAVLATDARKVVITLPNKGFNINYGLTEEESRHIDHHWEPRSGDMFTLLAEVAGCGRKAKMHVIGNVIDNEPMCFGVVFEAKNNDSESEVAIDQPQLEAA